MKAKDSHFLIFGTIREQLPTASGENKAVDTVPLLNDGNLRGHGQPSGGTESAETRETVGTDQLSASSRARANRRRRNDILFARVSDEISSDRLPGII